MLDNFRNNLVILSNIFSHNANISGHFVQHFWGRCYDFLNIFAEKFYEKFSVFDLKQS
jgi:hypothetical protein